mmetsp:Transcript_9670/g.25774  ORF Transcript_9670/g.25774 Transcript_9670/m.25774 type:complete len:230 (+) Transcript_9670:440-1129(+)
MAFAATAAAALDSRGSAKSPPKLVEAQSGEMEANAARARSGTDKLSSKTRASAPALAARAASSKASPSSSFPRSTTSAVHPCWAYAARSSSRRSAVLCTHDAPAAQPNLAASSPHLPSPSGDSPRASNTWSAKHRTRARPPPVAAAASATIVPPTQASSSAPSLIALSGARPPSGSPILNSARSSPPTAFATATSAWSAASWFDAPFVARGRSTATTFGPGVPGGARGT